MIDGLKQRQGGRGMLEEENWVEEEVASWAQSEAFSHVECLLHWSSCRCCAAMLAGS